MKNLKTFTTYLLCMMATCALQSQTITGKIVDEATNEPLIGVSIHLKGTSEGTITDMDGNYSITLDSINRILVFAYIGYTSQEIEIGDQKAMDVALSASSATLDEVVVTGASRVRGLSSFSHRGSRKKASTATPSAAEGYSGTNSRIRAGLLTAGEINDFSKWILWNDKSQQELRDYQKIWSIAPAERYSVMMQNKEGLPIAGQTVLLVKNQQDTIWVAKTDNVGRAELWSNMFGGAPPNTKGLSLLVNHNGKDYSINKAKPFNKGINHFTIDTPCDFSSTVDAVFIVDATSSMHDEIAYLKKELNDVIKSVQKEKSALRLRLGSVFYRDHGDTYITKKSDLSSDISQTINFIKNQSADGGGDFPEAADEAIEVALHELNWSKNALTKIIFLVLDAPPHASPENIDRIKKVTKKAAKEGIKIIPVTASGIDKSAEYLLRSLALSTNGTYVFLTDHSGIGNPHLKPTTDDYEVEKLNDLLIRLFLQYTSIVDCKKEITYEAEAPNYAGIPQKSKKEYLCTFYPNPTNGPVNIEVKGEVKELYICDISGKILQRIAVNEEKLIRTDISSYPKGVYLLTYFDEENKPGSGRIVLSPER
jgi:hypothetical protein